MARHALYPRRPRRVASERASHNVPLREVRTPACPNGPARWLGTRCTRAALGAWRPNGHPTTSRSGEWTVPKRNPPCPRTCGGSVAETCETSLSPGLLPCRPKGVSVFSVVNSPPVLPFPPRNTRKSASPGMERRLGKMPFRPFNHDSVTVQRTDRVGARPSRYRSAWSQREGRASVCPNPKTPEHTVSVLPSARGTRMGLALDYEQGNKISSAP